MHGVVGYMGVLLIDCFGRRGLRMVLRVVWLGD